LYEASRAPAPAPGGVAPEDSHHLRASDALLEGLVFVALIAERGLEQEKQRQRAELVCGQIFRFSERSLKRQRGGA
jgi:hypothetical protein